MPTRIDELNNLIGLHESAIKAIAKTLGTNSEALLLMNIDHLIECRMEELKLKLALRS